jgi:hypothetical protein
MPCAVQVTASADVQVLLGSKAFFGGDKPSIGDFWVSALMFSWERNTQGKEVQVGTPQLM